LLIHRPCTADPRLLLTSAVPACPSLVGGRAPPAVQHGETTAEEDVEAAEFWCVAERKGERERE
jgi:hypothetical protein